MAGSVTFVLKNPKTKKTGTKNPETIESGTKKPDTNTQTPILMVYYYGDTQIVVSTGERIAPKHWIKKDHKARETQDNPEGKNLNTRLETNKTNVMNAVRDHLNENGTIIKEKLKKELVDILRPKPETEKEQEQEQEPMTFLKSIAEYKTTCSRSPKTKVSYQSTINTLKDYNDYQGAKNHKKELSFEDINLDFYESFMNYLVMVKKFAKNTIGKDIKNIKVFMNYANDKGYTANQWHKHRKFKKIEETAETIYLNDKELESIYNKDLKDNPKLDRIRDLFIIGCYTGLRFSDLSQITPANFTNNGTRLRVKTIKTGEIVVIPLHWTIKEILQKYDNSLPRAISNQKFNEYLKVLGENADIKENVTITKTKGGLSFEKQFKKHDLITVHTARRSFATNMYLAGVPSISIMKITGHTTEKAFLKYIKISQEQNADLLAKHKYFIKPLKVVKSPRKKAVNQ